MVKQKEQNKEALGKGIRSLLQHIDSDFKTMTGLKTDVVEAVTHISRIPVEAIFPNPKNPRREYNEEAL